MNYLQVQCYHPLAVQNHKIQALEFNLDVRRYSSASAYKTRPHFYESIGDIINEYDTFIVCKTLNTSLYLHLAQPSYESEYLPEYVVKLSKA